MLIKAAREKDTRRSLLLLGAILDTPGLAERLLEALRPEVASGDSKRETRGDGLHHAAHRKNQNGEADRHSRGRLAGAERRRIR